MIFAFSLAVSNVLAVSPDIYFQNTGTINSNLSNKDLVVLIQSIVTWVLGLLALVAVIMIIIGGFMWMTAGGNDDKVGSAKKYIISAVIGLIVILAAWIIVNFVIRQFTNLA